MRLTPTFLLIFLVALVPVFHLTPLDAAPLVTSAAAKSVDANFEGFEDGKLLFNVQGSRKSVDAAELVRWGQPRESTEGLMMFGTDGGLWVIDRTFSLPNIVDDQVEFDTEFFESVKLPLELARGLVFVLPEDAPTRDRLLTRINTATGAKDVVILDNGDELRGTITSLQGDALNLRSANGDISVGIRKLVAIIFNPALAKAPPRADKPLLVGLTDGSLLHASQWRSDESRVVLTTAGDRQVSTPRQNIAFLQTLGGKATYLSDIKASSYRHRPFLQMSWPYHNDRNAAGGRLRCEGRLYEKGIGMHSAAGLTFRLDKPYSRLHARLGIDDAAKGDGSVIFRVYADSGAGWQQKYESDVVRGGRPSIPISVDIAGARRLSLIVDFADRGDQRDLANWLDARLLP